MHNHHGFVVVDIAIHFSRFKKWYHIRQNSSNTGLLTSLTLGRYLTNLSYPFLRW